MGLSLGIFLHTAVQDLLVKWFYEKRSQVIGGALAGTTFGIFLFQLAMTHLLPRFGVRMSFIIIAVLAVVPNLIMVFLIKESKDVGQKALGYEKDPEYIGTTNVGAVDIVAFAARREAATAALYKSPVFWLLLAGVMFLSRAVCALGDYGTGYLPKIGISFTTAGTIVSVMNLSTGIFTLLLLALMAGKIGGEWSSYVLCITCIFATFCALVLMETGMNWIVIIALILVYAIGMAAQPFSNILAPELYGTDLSSIVNTKFQAGCHLAALVCYPVWASIIENFGYIALWQFNVGIGAFSLLAFIAAFAIEKKKDMEGTDSHVAKFMD
jgi:hypothetical protein